MTKKTKFATALWASALLSHGFILERVEEVPPEEPKLPAETVSDKEIKTTIEPQHLVEEEEI